MGQILQFRQQASQRAGVGTSPTSTKPAAPLKSLNQLNSLGALLGPAAVVVRPAAATASGGFAAEVDALVPRRFLEEVSFPQLPHLPRYLKALVLRIERAANNPPKEAERVKLVAPYVTEARRLRTTPPATPEARQLADEFRWLVEEYKVSVFAQELGTAKPASPKRLDELLERLRAAG